MTYPYAKVITDSMSLDGTRLTTFEVRFHRFVLAEFNTHRVFSRNSASSRAIPFPKQLEKIEAFPAIPVSFPAEQRGMQGGEEVEPRGTVEAAWLLARNDAVTNAKFLHSMGVHKSVVNRLLEPFMWHTAIVTSTAWDNFFRQRCHKDAQPEIQAPAKLMQQAYNESTPVFLREGEWHLPYIQPGEDFMGLTVEVGGCLPGVDEPEEFERVELEIRKYISAARCARVSYLTHDGARDPLKDLELYDRLVTRDNTEDPEHWSPLEHVATPANWNKHVVDVDGLELVLPKVGNFLGWKQHRIEVEAKRHYQSFA